MALHKTYLRIEKYFQDLDKTKQMKMARVLQHDQWSKATKICTCHSFCKQIIDKKNYFYCSAIILIIQWGLLSQTLKKYLHSFLRPPCSTVHSVVYNWCVLLLMVTTFNVTVPFVIRPISSLTNSFWRQHEKSFPCAVLIVHIHSELEAFHLTRIGGPSCHDIFFKI